MAQAHPNMAMPSRNPGLPPRPRCFRPGPYYKTRLCDKFPLGFCPYGLDCTYAHGIEDLCPPATLQPLQEKQPCEPNYPEPKKEKDKVCFKYLGGRNCEFGERCIFRHQRPENQPHTQIMGATGAVTAPVPEPGLAATQFHDAYNSNGRNGNIHHLVKASGQDEDMDDMVTEITPRWQQGHQPTSYFRWKNPVSIGQIYGDWPDRI